MGDAAAYPEPAQLLQQFVVGLAAVQQHGQVVVARDFQLLDVEVFLGREVKVPDKQIETDFADRDRTPCLALRTQVRQNGRASCRERVSQFRTRWWPYH